MRRLLLLVMMCVCVPIGALAAVYEMKDYNPGTVVATLSVDGSVATIEFTGNGDVTNFNMDAMGNTPAAGITEVVVNGAIPENVNNSFLDYFNNANHGVLQNCTRMDFSQATGKLPSSVHNKVNGVILPNGKSFSDVSGGNYIVIANTGDSEPNAVEVCVKSGTSWASDPAVDDATYLKVYGSDGTTALESDEVTALRNSKWVNGSGTVITVEDLTINADSEDEASVLSTFLESHKIKNLTVTGELTDLAIFNQVPVKNDADFSGLTNSDLSTLKLPTVGGTIKLPGGNYLGGTIKLDEGYTTAQLNNIMVALASSGLSYSTIEFPGGTTYNTAGKTLTVSTADEDGGKLRAIADEIRNAGFDITYVKLEKYGTSWSSSSQRMTLNTAYEAQKEAQKALLEGARFTVSEVKVTSHPDISVSVDANGAVVIRSSREGALQELLNATDDEAVAAKALINADSAKGVGSKLILQGAYKADDLTQLAQLNNATETVDMANTTFSNYDDMKFSLWGSNLKEAVTSLNAPDSYTTGPNNFSSANSNLETVTYNSGIVGKVYDNNTSVKTVKIGPNAVAVADNAYHATKVTTLDMSNANNLKVIGQDAFSDTYINGTLTIAPSVELIKNSAFKDIEIETLIIPSDSHLQTIEKYAFHTDVEVHGKPNPLKNVYVNVHRIIACDVDAFSYWNCDGQTQIKATGARTRLYYPVEYYAWYVGLYKQNINNGNLNGQDHLILNRTQATNGWQRFISSGVLMSPGTTWRTYSDVVPLVVPQAATNVEVFLVDGYDVENDAAVLVKMDAGDYIPTGTGVLIHYPNVDATNGSVLYLDPAMEKSGNKITAPDGTEIDEWVFIHDAYMMEPYENQYHSSNKYKGQYDNYLVALNVSSLAAPVRIDNVEIVNGRKTYRNYFFSPLKKLPTAENGRWIDEVEWAKWISADYAALDWGFVRAYSDTYQISQKAYLHFPVGANFPGRTSGAIHAQATAGSDIAAKQFPLTFINREEFDIANFKSPFADEEATSINGVAETSKCDNTFYTLQGVKVVSPAKNGIYIYNGKKYIVK